MSSVFFQSFFMLTLEHHKVCGSINSRFSFQEKFSNSDDFSNFCSKTFSTFIAHSSAPRLNVVVHGLARTFYLCLMCFDIQQCFVTERSRGIVMKSVWKIQKKFILTLVKVTSSKKHFSIFRARLVLYRPCLHKKSAICLLP